jgi:hypothetical protein
MQNLSPPGVVIDAGLRALARLCITAPGVDWGPLALPFMNEYHEAGE